MLMSLSQTSSCQSKEYLMDLSRWSRELARTLANTLRARRKPGRTRAHGRLFLEALEERIMPVIGAFAVPSPIVVGQGYDGVVMITSSGQTSTTGDTGTGSLLYTGRHILSAAHVFDHSILPDGSLGPGDRNVD